MNNQKVLFYFLVIFISLLFITTCSNIYSSKVNEINEGFQTDSIGEFNCYDFDGQPGNCPAPDCVYKYDNNWCDPNPDMMSSIPEFRAPVVV